MANFEEKMCRAAAKSLIFSIDTLLSAHFEHNEITDELITELSKLNLNQQSLLVKRAKYFLSISIDEGALKRQLSELEDVRKKQELEETYLLLGAPLFLMRRLFGMHASEFSRRRGVLKIQGAGSGRPKQCDETVEHTIWQLWRESNDLDERDRFILIAEKTGHDLHLICSVLREYIDK